MLDMAGRPNTNGGGVRDLVPVLLPIRRTSEGEGDPPLAAPGVKEH